MRRLSRWLPGSQQGSRGQAAVGFLALMALILLLAASTMNIGEVAKIRTGTANAADAGALAFASWVASAENEVALAAEGMWMNWMMTQLVFLLPFCAAVCWMILLYYAALIWVNHFTLYEQVAKPILAAAWDNGTSAAVFSAIQNAQIDDPSGEAAAQVKALSDAAKGGLSPGPHKITWTRLGAGGKKEESWVEITVQRGSKPKLEMDGWGPFAFCLFPCIAWCCWPMPAWGGGQQDVKGSASEGQYTTSMGKTAGPAFTQLFGFITLPNISMCQFCFPIPVTLGSLAEITPSEISDGEGQVTVIVRQHRQGGTNLGVWTMQYPDVITSSATAKYTESEVGMWPESKSKSELVSVL